MESPQAPCRPRQNWRRMEAAPGFEAACRGHWKISRYCRRGSPPRLDTTRVSGRLGACYERPDDSTAEPGIREADSHCEWSPSRQAGMLEPHPSLDSRDELLGLSESLSGLSVRHDPAAS